ncbi:MAG: hypothetical protein V4738_09455, partial [Pseudomonadota bacterium]
ALNYIPAFYHQSNLSEIFWLVLTCIITPPNRFNHSDARHLYLLKQPHCEALDRGLCAAD